MSILSRRTFLAGSAASAVTAVSPALGAVPASGEVDIAIIGAGAAGIAAARRVAAAKLRFALIEASPRIGGRCITETATFGVPYDRGAHWLHLPRTNPVVRLSNDSGFEIYTAPRGLKLRLGPRAARESELEDYFSMLVRANRAIIEAGRGSKDRPADQALPAELGDWRSTVAFSIGPYSVGKELNEISATDMARAAERGIDAFCRQGYGALLARLASGLPAQLSTPVRGIEWGHGLEIETARGRIRARALIVTVSTGVLASGAIKFSPELPKRQGDAIAALSLGSYDHVALDIPGNPFGLDRDDLVIEKSSGPKTAALLANIGGTSLCTVDVAGAFGRELTRDGPEAMLAFAGEWLDAIFGNDISDAITRSAVTRWNHEPWALGAFSAARPGGADARKMLMEPLRERVWFAGEAVHESLWGTVGGAWESGTRAAEAALKKLGALKDPKTKAADDKPARRRSRRRRRR
jgi:monoamine oxidase